MSTTVKSISLLPKHITALTGQKYEGPWNDARRGMVQASVDGTGAVAATITVNGSNDGVHTTVIGTITLTATTTDTDTLAIDYPWAHIWAVSSGISGTGATVSANLSL